MKSFVKIGLLLLLNILVSVSATLAVLYYWENVRNVEKPYTLVNTITQPAPTYEIDEGIVIPTATLIMQPIITAEGNIPPARNSRIKISQVIGAGDINTEMVQLENVTDHSVSLENWKIEDADGNSYLFPNILLIRKGIFLPVYSRAGHNTPFELYWGSQNPIWQSGETVVLKDQDGNVQSTYRIP